MVGKLVVKELDDLVMERRVKRVAAGIEAPSWGRAAHTKQKKKKTGKRVEKRKKRKKKEERRNKAKIKEQKRKI